MTRRFVAIAAALLITLSGCQRASTVYEREESGGTGFGVTHKSAITVQDLYFFSVSSTRDEVLTALGSPQTYIISDGNTDTYSLNDGATLTLKYSTRGLIESATYTDAAKVRWDLFDFLVEVGVLTSHTGQNTSAGNNGVGSNTSPVGSETTPEMNNPTTTTDNPTDTNYFSTKRYSYDMADQLLSVGVARETVVSALGKPNSFSSVTFAKDSYLIDVYAMDDGSRLYLDYGFSRTNLRAARVVRGSTVSSYLGTWGAEEKPSTFYRNTKNLNLFTTLTRNARPSEIYRRYGAPDWFEGTADSYRDAYQLMNGDILYLDFGAGHSSLSSASVLRSNGTVTAYGLR